MPKNINHLGAPGAAWRRTIAHRSKLSFDRSLRARAVRLERGELFANNNNNNNNSNNNNNNNNNDKSSSTSADSD
jgi:Zn-finger nucleic acid-binding protein